MAGPMDFLRNNSMGLTQMGLGLLSGKTGTEQAALGAQGLAGALQNNKTVKFLQSSNPELAQAVMAGAISPGDAWKLAYQQKLEAQKPKNAFMQAGGSLYNTDTGEWLTPPQTAKQKDDPYSQRKLAAEQNGLMPDDPAYQSFILTGKMPREDQAPLTATDKKAILEADDLVAANENAITALDQALSINDQANQGAFASTRGALGNALPDWMVPDAVSSKESSAATAEFDNLIVGQALASLKATFGAAPTEGERKILLELQGSAGQPVEVRKSILQRARALAERRLEFNRQRAEGLRGGTFYKPSGAGGSSVDDLLKKYGG
ncbi:hypothetical protein [Shinella fusca]|uniref:Uncharacterized protein n=1 Tax=Shinella fusca TaxID=544480 RepID=A0A7W8DSS7_9HYPH|nr:hypothetical protein [Shinella fusca]MBB5040802.1 hypothetical protein [Shinella fusca]